VSGFFVEVSSRGTFISQSIWASSKGEDIWVCDRVIVTCSSGRGLSASYRLVPRSLVPCPFLLFELLSKSKRQRVLLPKISSILYLSQWWRRVRGSMALAQFFGCLASREWCFFVVVVVEGSVPLLCIEEISNSLCFFLIWNSNYCWLGRIWKKWVMAHQKTIPALLFSFRVLASMRGGSSSSGAIWSAHERSQQQRVRRKRTQTHFLRLLGEEWDSFSKFRSGEHENHPYLAFSQLKGSCFQGHHVEAARHFGMVGGASEIS